MIKAEYMDSSLLLKFRREPTVSDRIRAAALGPAPSGYAPTIGMWIDRNSDVCEAYRFKNHGEMFSCMHVYEQRMFLLFVAEALE